MTRKLRSIKALLEVYLVELKELEHFRYSICGTLLKAGWPAKMMHSGLAPRGAD